MSRRFKDSAAVRQRVPLLIGLVGISGCGKTFSALRLATGIQRVTGGDIYVIDTEANRALHYAPKAGEKADPSRGTFDFRHVPFVAPFGPLDYLAAIEHCVKSGAKTIIIDSMSHEHEGPGGVLEMHEAELDRMHERALKRNPRAYRDTNNFRAWAKPKAERQRLLNSMIQMPVNFILCFRAKEKTKPKAKGDGGDKSDLIDLGWMPIGGEAILYEMTARALLPPNADGVPQWRPEKPGERLIFKLPAQFRDLFGGTPHALCEADGEALAKWAEGGPRPAGPKPSCFSSRLAWPGREEWGGRSLADAPADALAAYGNAIETAIAAAKTKKTADAMRANLAEVRAAQAAISAPEPPPDADAPEASDPRTPEQIEQGWDVDPNTGEAVPPVGGEG